MSAQFEMIEAQALSLTPEERAQLADRLITSLFDGQDIESGRAKLIPASEALARARAAIK